jgi:hypothetical protein
MTSNLETENPGFNIGSIIQHPILSELTTKKFEPSSSRKPQDFKPEIQDLTSAAVKTKPLIQAQFSLNETVQDDLKP